MVVITKVAFRQGMSPYVFVTYRQVSATIAIAPFAYFLERMEKVNIRSLRGQAKIFGTVICVGGAMLMTLIKGPSIHFFDFLKTSTSLSEALGTSSAAPAARDNWILGPFLLILSVIAYASWVVYQAWAFKNYPAKMSVTAMMLFIGAIQAAVVGVIFDRSSAWRLYWNFELFTYVYSGVMCSAVAFIILSWCIKKRGPVFPAAFTPLCTVFVAILEPIALHVDIHVGGVVGMFTVIAGLYAVLWGKAKDGKTDNEIADNCKECSLDNKDTESKEQVNIAHSAKEFNLDVKDMEGKEYVVEVKELDQ
ncbi:hypothetical protein AMTRI_Chr10g230260 [Amborella trichopoda]